MDLIGTVKIACASDLDTLSISLRQRDINVVAEEINALHLMDLSCPRLRNIFQEVKRMDLDATAKSALNLLIKRIEKTTLRLNPKNERARRDTDKIPMKKQKKRSEIIEQQGLDFR